MVFLGWPDNVIMDCDMARLTQAINVKAKAAKEEREFQMAIHGMKPKENRPMPVSTKEFNERARASFIGLKTTVVRRIATAA